LFDLSEGGLSVFGGREETGNRKFNIEFHLPGVCDPIRAGGEIAWWSKSRNLTGIRFSQLEKESRLHLRTWMASRVPVAKACAEYNPPDFASRFINALREKWEALKL
jgi:hypothetical protein